MNEQEKEFMAFVEWLPKNIEKFVNAKPEDIISYLEELGKTPEGQNELKSLITKYKQSKNTVTLNKKGGKVETLIKKFYAGGPYRDTVEVHNKWRFIPLWMSINAANGVDVPKKHNTHDQRQFKFIKSPNGQRWGIIQNKVNGRSTIFELDSNNEPISSEYGGQKYEYGDDMFRKHVNNYNFYTKDIFIPSDKKGGKIDNLVEKFQHSGKIPNQGEIKQDNRSEIGKWWNSLKFKYQNSNWNNSAINEVLTYTTPWGIVDSMLEGNVKDGIQEALISILPIGITIDKLSDAVKAASKSNPLRFIKVKGYENFPIGNGRIVSKKKGVLNEDIVQQLYNNNPKIRDLVDKGYNVTRDGKVIMPNGRSYDPDFNYVSNAKDIERAIRQQSPQRYGESLDVSSGVDRGSNYRGYTYGGSKVKHTW